MTVSIVQHARRYSLSSAPNSFCRFSRTHASRLRSRATMAADNGISFVREQIGEHRCSGSRRGRELLRVVRLGAGRSPTGLNFNPRIIAPHRRLRISNVGFARSLIPRSLATNCRPDPKECIAGRMKKR